LSSFSAPTRACDLGCLRLRRLVAAWTSCALCAVCCLPDRRFAEIPMCSAAARALLLRVSSCPCSLLSAGDLFHSKDAVASFARGLKEFTMVMKASPFLIFCLVCLQYLCVSFFLPVLLHSPLAPWVSGVLAAVACLGLLSFGLAPSVLIPLLGTVLRCAHCQRFRSQRIFADRPLSSFCFCQTGSGQRVHEPRVAAQRGGGELVFLSIC
jgi:hypothetical protein